MWDRNKVSFWVKKIYFFQLKFCLNYLSFIIFHDKPARFIRIFTPMKKKLLTAYFFRLNLEYRKNVYNLSRRISILQKLHNKYGSQEKSEIPAIKISAIRKIRIYGLTPLGNFSENNILALVKIFFAACSQPKISKRHKIL